MAENSVNYYNENASAFLESTQNVDMSEHYGRFLAHVKENGTILDLGCGSGRDSLSFLERGYDVLSVDGSDEMCRAAQRLTGRKCECMLFEELDFEERFDGIWACASLLHVPKDEMVPILTKVRNALKIGGALYLSYKYGETQRTCDGRLFSDYTEESARKLIWQVGGFSIRESWVTEDVRPEKIQKWINLVCIKENVNETEKDGEHNDGI